MGTQKQADTIINLMGKGKMLGNLPNGRTCTPREHEEAMRAYIADASQEEMKALFARVNEKLNFSKDATGATEPQLKFIRDLEVKLYGTNVTNALQEHLTYKEADLRIKRLQLELAEAKALNAPALTIRELV